MPVTPLAVANRSPAGARSRTEFGTFYSPNITPDASDGHRRLDRSGSSGARSTWESRATGRCCIRAFPYPSFTKITQDDAHALWEYLKTVKPVSRRPEPHTLRFPYSYRPLLRVWRALYFQPGVYKPDAAQSASWNRGAYLAEGVAQCNLCHVPRTGLGGPDSSARGRGAERAGLVRACARSAHGSRPAELEHR